MLTRAKPLTWCFLVERVTERVTTERVTGIEPALSAWEVSSPFHGLPAGTLTCGHDGALSMSDRGSPRGFALSGT